MSRNAIDKLFPHGIIATTIEDAWYQCLFKLIDEGWVFHVDRGSYAGKDGKKGQHRLQFGAITVQIKFPGQEPQLPIIPPELNIPPPVDKDYVENYLPYILTDVINPNELYTYGQRIHAYEYFEEEKTKKTPRNVPIKKYVNQYKKTVEMLKNNSGTNQAVIEIGDPQSILLEDPPCLRLIQAMIIDGELHFYVVFRSWDLWGGFPANLAAIQALKILMVADINDFDYEKEGAVKDGQIIAFSPGLHIYEYVWNLAERASRVLIGSIAEKHKDEMKEDVIYLSDLTTYTELLKFLKIGGWRYPMKIEKIEK